MNLITILGLTFGMALYAAAAVETKLMPEVEPSITITELELERPEYEWVRCTCPNGSEVGLTESDFIKHQMYMAGLEHEAQSCVKEPIQFYKPERKNYAQRIDNK